MVVVVVVTCIPWNRQALEDRRSYFYRHGQRTVKVVLNERDESRYNAGSKEEAMKAEAMSPGKRRRAHDDDGVPRRRRNNGSFETRLPFPFNDAYVSMGRSRCT